MLGIRFELKIHKIEIDTIFSSTFLSLLRHVFSQIKDYDARYLEQVVSLMEMCMALFNASAWNLEGYGTRRVST